MTTNLLLKRFVCYIELSWFNGILTEYCLCERFVISIFCIKEKEICHNFYCLLFSHFFAFDEILLTFQSYFNPWIYWAKKIINVSTCNIEHNYKRVWEQDAQQIQKILLFFFFLSVSCYCSQSWIVTTLSHVYIFPQQLYVLHHKHGRRNLQIPLCIIKCI